MVCVTLPPSLASNSARPMNQASTPGPVAIASHTCSGVAFTVIWSRTSNSCVVISGLLVSVFGGNARVDGDDHAVLATTLRVLVVVLADQRGDRAGEFVRERLAVGRRREPHLPLKGESGERLARLGGARDERANVAHHAG